MDRLFYIDGCPGDTFTAREWIADYCLFNGYRVSFEDAKDAFKRDYNRGLIRLAG